MEAGMVGARVIGTDIDYKMVNGTKKNLEHCGISNYQVFQEDARKLELPHKVDAIVTDPPTVFPHQPVERRAMTFTTRQ
nr:methyltransferase domain-containing protein [Methanobacterium formicicum]